MKHFIISICVQICILSFYFSLLDTFVGQSQTLTHFFAEVVAGGVLLHLLRYNINNVTDNIIRMTN